MAASREAMRSRSEALSSWLFFHVLGVIQCGDGGGLPQVADIERSTHAFMYETSCGVDTP